MGNGFKTALLLGALSGLLLVLGELLGGTSGLMIAFVFAVIMNFGSYWFSDRIVLRMYRAKEVGPGHPPHGMVERLARQAQPADASGLHHPDRLRQRLRHRAQPAARRRRGDRGDHAGAERAGAGRRHGALLQSR